MPNDKSTASDDMEVEGFPLTRRRPIDEVVIERGDDGLRSSSFAAQSVRYILVVTNTTDTAGRPCFRLEAVITDGRLDQWAGDPASGGLLDYATPAGPEVTARRFWHRRDRAEGGPRSKHPAGVALAVFGIATVAGLAVLAGPDRPDGSPVPGGSQRRAATAAAPAAPTPAPTVTTTCGPWSPGPEVSMALQIIEIEPEHVGATTWSLAHRDCGGRTEWRWKRVTI
jgi:hypothetical protein